MKLLFVNIAYPVECYEQFKKDTNGQLSNAVNTFQWAIIDGLEQSGCDYSMACVPTLPAWPRYKHLCTPSGVMTVDGKPRGHYLSFFDAPAIKQVHQRYVLRQYIREWCKKNSSEDKLIVLVYTTYAQWLGAALDVKKEFPNLIVVPIVTDLIDNAMDHAGNRTPLKRIQVKLEDKAEHKLYKYVDKFVLISKLMTECIPEAEGKNIVIECMAPKGSLDMRVRAKKNVEQRTLLYTGTLNEYGGVDMLVDAFLKTTDKRFKLVICGGGGDTTHIEEAAARDGRIDFKGSVSREEAVRLQQTSTMLINPRLPNGSITKYSFPSKTMEYMTSGTPMIGYKLEGIPDEYYKHMFIPASHSVEDLTACINETLLLPQEELDKKAKNAGEFIRINKNPKAQVCRMIEFLVK